MVSIKTKTDKNGNQIYTVRSTMKIIGVLSLVCAFILTGSSAFLLFLFLNEITFLYRYLLLFISVGGISLVYGCLLLRYRLTLTDTAFQKTGLFSTSILLTEIDRIEYASLYIKIHGKNGKKIKIPINAYHDTLALIDVLKTKITLDS